MNIQHQSSSISFENKFEFLSISTHLSANLCLDDVDCDGDNELVVCEWVSKELKDYGEADVENSLATISILKYMNIWRFAEFNGMATCVGVGNVCQQNQNVIVVCCADAYCYFFDVNSVDHSKTSTSSKIENKHTSFAVMAIWHKQRFPCNAKDVMIVDVDKDKIGEVIVSHSDRTVRMFKWDSNVEDFPSGALIQLMVWELSGQIGKISMHYHPDKGDQIMASQPGGSYAVLNFECISGRPTLTYFPLDRKKATNTGVRTEILGNIHPCRINKNSSSSTTNKSSNTNVYFAISSLDGTIQLHNEKKVIFDFQMDRNRELFGLCKVDLTGDNSDEVVVSSWDGVTIILNYKRQVVRFHSGAPCQAFTAGSYAVSPGKNKSVLVYSTFDNRIVMYYNMSFTQIPCVSVKHLVKQPFIDQLKQKGIDIKNDSQFRWAVRWLLYESPKEN